MNIEDFIALHGNPSGIIPPHFTTLEEAWNHSTDPITIVWIATRPGVLPDAVLQEFLRNVGGRPGDDAFRAALDCVITAQARLACTLRGEQSSWLLRNNRRLFS